MSLMGTISDETFSSKLLGKARRPVTEQTTIADDAAVTGATWNPSMLGDDTVVDYGIGVDCGQGQGLTAVFREAVIVIVIVVEGARPI